jgi:hypothetical protein
MKYQVVMLALISLLLMQSVEGACYRQVGGWVQYNGASTPDTGYPIAAGAAAECAEGYNVVACGHNLDSFTGKVCVLPLAGVGGRECVITPIKICTGGKARVTAVATCCD